MCIVFYVDFKNKSLIEKTKSVISDLDKEDQSLNKEKLKHFSSLINNGLTQVLVNGYVKNVALPKSMIKDYAIPINWSLKFNLKDFAFDLDGVRGTLSFSKKATFVNLPWEAIWLIHRPEQSNSSKIWEAEAPTNFDLSGF